MITFETLAGYVKAHQRVSKGEDLIREGLEMIGNDSHMYFEDATDYWSERMIDEAIGSEAMELLTTWMWDYNMGTDIPEESDISSDLAEFYNTNFVPSVVKHYGTFIKSDDNSTESSGC